MLERYKSYCNVLKGKQIMEQYLEAFNPKNIKDKYINYKDEKDNFWIYNTTRIMMDVDAYRTHIYNSEEYIKGSYSYSLYLHKIKDMVILVAPIICIKYSQQFNYNINRYFKFRFNKLGFNIVDINENQIPFGFNGPYATLRAKILIDSEKTDEDLQQLILFIEKLNNFIMDNDATIWDNVKDILKYIDPNFSNYVKNTVKCS